MTSLVANTEEEGDDADEEDADEEDDENAGEDEKVEEESAEQHLSLPELRGAAFTGSNFPAAKEWARRIKDLKDACFLKSTADDKESQRSRCITVAEELNEASDLFSGLAVHLKKAAESAGMYTKPVHRAIMWPKPYGVSGSVGHVPEHLRKAAALNRRIAKIHLAAAHPKEPVLDPKVGNHYHIVHHGKDPPPRNHAPTDPVLDLSEKEAGLDGMVAPWFRSLFLTFAPAQHSWVLDVQIKPTPRWNRKLRYSMDRRDEFL